MKRIVIILGSVCILAMLAWVAFAVLKHRSKAQDADCIANLIQMDGATCSWAIEAKKGPDDSPLKAEMFGSTLYIRAEPVCLKSGRYTLGSPSKAPTCSYPGHQIRINPSVWKESGVGPRRYLDR